LEVADDGRGFDPASAAGRGMGLRSMRERIEALDGELTVESAPGTGTRLIARCELE
jgi:signal transduction histidine kinase